MEKKWTLFFFSHGDFKAVERYLNEQAAKGWELETARVLARWKRTERRDLRYCVDLANSKADECDVEHYMSLCTESGWEFIGAPNKMYVFKSAEGKNPPQIQTDAHLEWDNYRKFYIRNMLRAIIISLFVMVLCTANLAIKGSWNDLTENFSSGLHLWCWMISVVALWLFVLWRTADFIRAMICSREKKVLCSPRWVMWANNVAAGLAVIFDIILLVTTLI